MVDLQPSQDDGEGQGLAEEAKAELSLSKRRFQAIHVSETLDVAVKNSRQAVVKLK